MLLAVLVYFENYANNSVSFCKLSSFQQKNNNNKKAEIMLLTFYFEFGKKKKKTPQCFIYKYQLPCLHQETLRVLNSLSDKYKNSTNKQPTRGRYPR